MATDGAGGELSPGDVDLPEVMLLGTYHMANPGADLVNVDVDSPLHPRRQRELDDVVPSLGSWEPHLVGVEYPVDRNDRLNELLEAFRSGVASYTDPSALPDGVEASFLENEIVQLGIRLALEVDHDEITAIDHEAHIPAWTSEEAMSGAVRDPPPPDLAGFEVPDPRLFADEQARRLKRSTVGEYLAWLNRPEQLRVNHAMLFGSCFTHDRIDPAVGTLIRWYERNLRMAYEIVSRFDGSDTRLVLIVGSGHVRILWHLLDEAPMCRPISCLDRLE